MYIETKDKFNILHAEENYSMYSAEQEKLYKDTAFFKLAYIPKTLTLQQVKTLYKQILDTQIDKLPNRDTENGTADK